MQYEIKHRYRGAVLFAGEYDSLCDCVIAAAKARANLAGADLARAYLAGAYLAGAYLAGANLADADLAGAYLADADLAGADLARADLARADLAGANLADANLADAYLADARGIDPAAVSASSLSRDEWLATRTQSDAERAARYRERNPTIPVVENLDAQILAAIESGGALQMNAWHTCETTHCRAGWAITLAGTAGKELETRLGPARAGAAIYRASAGRVPHFYASNTDALADIKACAARAQS